MRELLWLAVPLLATLVAIAWNSWRTRTRGPDEAIDSVQAYERFRAALTVPAQPTGDAPARRDRRGRVHATR